MEEKTNNVSLSHITDPDIALQALKDGNKRFISGDTLNQDVDFALKKKLSESGQAPYAVVLSCADSRLLPKRAFDQTIGDLFLLQIAGNIVSPEEIGSMEFAVEFFNSCLIVIMGHQGCGAITAAVKSSPDDQAFSTIHLDTIMNRLKAVVEDSADQRSALSEEDYIDYCVDHNVRRGLEELTNQSEFLRERMKSGKLKMVGAKYILDTGEVVFDDFHTLPAD
ncbi:Carbonic anhydrase 2 [Jeotgalibaca dankookensis]|uniref:carbonic anhydrase n=1 Tax=Jeotgalibaca dankookensis TaxID=708126 RepID=A0A1S6IPZ4_9LACT|nr:carbonic anhydrase [Jeotgalibaca dankookensis]AQS53622.1 Carbonic anhydrase 2 [Jeotgalibaca dankookensis]